MQHKMFESNQYCSIPNISKIKEQLIAWNINTELTIHNITVEFIKKYLQPIMKLQ